jgi:hypothetical protein
MRVVKEMDNHGVEAVEVQLVGNEANVAGNAAAAAAAGAAADTANTTAAAAGGVAAVELQQQPLDPMQQLVNQLNAELQQQNQMAAPANAAQQLVQQIVEELQQAGVPEEEIAQIEAQELELIAMQQPQEAEELEVLPEEDTSNTAVLRQLQARLDAGECSIPVPKQLQMGPLPLWQQCLLEVVTNHMPMLPAFRTPNELIPYLTSGMLVADSAAEAGGADADAGVTPPLQRLLGSEQFAAGPPVAPQPGRLPWGRLVAQAAVEVRQPQLLAWALLQQQQRV